MEDKYNRIPNYKCDICGKPIYVRPSRLAKQKWGTCCSKECGSILRSMNTKGEKIINMV